jgi:hypothetical protein
LIVSERRVDIQIRGLGIEQKNPSVQLYHASIID